LFYFIKLCNIAFIQQNIFYVEGSSSVTKLSTFMGGLSSRSNSNMVQMRRSTNKKGKQAPAPPKRTRYIIFFLIKHNHNSIYNKAMYLLWQLTIIVQFFSRFCLSRARPTKCRSEHYDAWWWHRSKWYW